ncbi:MAG TPA: polymer-forming cytoskeletal protein [Polyangiaceae bacterium]|nr:polymer-forming cytoskeletal protein [Polyangiaceae bacterium]
MASALPATELTALLGRGTHFEGKLHFEGRVRIDGTFRGEIRGDDALVIGEGAEVEAEIEAGVVIVKGGTLTGNVRAAHSIELYVPARASGTLHAPEVHIEKGVQFAGTCTIGPLEGPPAVTAPDGAPNAPAKPPAGGVA